MDLTSVQVYSEVVENPYEDTGKDDVTALTGVVNEYFPDMREWICDYLLTVKEKVGVAIVCRTGDIICGCREWLLKTLRTTVSWQKCLKFFLYWSSMVTMTMKRMLKKC